MNGTSPTDTKTRTLPAHLKRLESESIEIMREVIAPPGVLTRTQPDALAMSDIARGVEVARLLGAADVGQGCVVQQGLVLAVEAIDFRAAKRIDRISGLREPQGVAYSEKADLILVTNAGDGSVRMFRGADLAALGRLDLHDDADNIRIDPRTGQVVVGYGSGGLAIIDPVNRAEIGSIALQGHPESFQIEPMTRRVFVNVPDAGQIAVVDLDARRQVATWRVAGVRANFPMALDSGKNVLATVFRKPPSLALLDTKSGSVVTKLPACGDADDVFFDTKRDRIYISCGAGEIAIFQRDGQGYRPLTAVKTSSGARTSLFIPELDRLFLAERAGLLGSKAAIKVYRPAS